MYLSLALLFILILASFSLFFCSSATVGRLTFLRSFHESLKHAGAILVSRASSTAGLFSDRVFV